MKYKCLDCNMSFEKDENNNKCPSCNSENIKKEFLLVANLGNNSYNNESCKDGICEFNKN